MSIYYPEGVSAAEIDRRFGSSSRESDQILTCEEDDGGCGFVGEVPVVDHLLYVGRDEVEYRREWDCPHCRLRHESEYSVERQDPDKERDEW